MYVHCARYSWENVQKCSRLKPKCASLPVVGSRDSTMRRKCEVGTALGAKNQFLVATRPVCTHLACEQNTRWDSLIKGSQALFLHNLLSSEASQYSEKWGEAEYDVDHFLMTLSNHLVSMSSVLQQGVLTAKSSSLYFSDILAALLPHLFLKLPTYKDEGHIWPRLTLMLRARGGA